MKAAVPSVKKFIHLIRPAGAMQAFLKRVLVPALPRARLVPTSYPFSQSILSAVEIMCIHAFVPGVALWVFFTTLA